MPTRLIDLPFTSGLNESVDETVAPLPSMTELVNYRLTRSGRLEHRLGVKEVGITVALNAGEVAGPDGNMSQAVHNRTVVAGGHAYTQMGLGGWTCSGSVSRYVPYDSFTGLIHGSSTYTNVSCASVFSYLAVIGRYSSGAAPPVELRLFDEATGSEIWQTFPSADVGAGLNSRGRVVACGSTLVTVIWDPTSTNLHGTSIDMSVQPIPATGFPSGTVIDTSTALYGFDAATVDESNYIIGYYAQGPARVFLRRVNASSHASVASVSIAASSSYATCLYYSSRYYLAWSDTVSGELRVAVFSYSGTFVQIGSTVTVATGLVDKYRPVLCGNGDGDGVIVGWTDRYTSGAFVSYQTWFADVTSTSTLGTVYGPLINYTLASKPFVASTAFAGTNKQPAVWLENYVPTLSGQIDRSYFLATVPKGTTDDVQFVLEMSASPSKGQLLPGGLNWQPCDVVQSDSGNLLQTVLLEGFRGLGESTQQNRAQVYRFMDAATSLRARTRSVIDCQGSFAVLGGAPRFYDGAWMNEIGIPHGPAIFDADTSLTGSMATGTYQYVFVLEYYDAKSQRNLSYVSTPYSVTLAPGKTGVSFSVAVPTLWAASNAGTGTTITDPRSITLRAYRTASNTGTVYRYSPDATRQNGVFAGPYNSWNITYNDENADATIAANEAVYVQVGNALSNYRAPACRFGCEHEGRLVVAGGWNPKEAYCSKLFFAGEGIQFTESAAFTITCPEDITACASLDGTLILFTERSIYTVTGDGPLDDGSGAFSSPRRLPGRIGCIDWRGVVTREDGVYFRAADGVYMLPRGLGSPVFVGSAVRESMRQYPETLGVATATRTVSASVDDHDSEQVVAWLVGNAENPTAVAIYMLSLATGAWTQVSLPESGGGPQTVIGVWRDLAESSDVLAFTRKTLDSAVAGSLLVENVGTTYDRDISGSFEPLLNGYWKTGKLFPFGFGGRGSIRSIRIVGECLSATTITPTVWHDANTAGETHPTLSIAAGRFQVEIPFRRRDLAWVQIRVQDPTTGSENRGAGLRFNGLALEVEMEGGLHRTTPGERST